MTCKTHFNAFIELIIFQVWDYFYYIMYPNILYSTFTYCCLSIFKGMITPTIIDFKFIFVTNYYQYLVYHCLCPRFSLMVHILVIWAVTERHNNGAFELHSDKITLYDFCQCCEYWEHFESFPLFYVFFRCCWIIVMMFFPWVDIHENPWQCKIGKSLLHPTYLNLHTMDFWCEIAILSMWK